MVMEKRRWCDRAALVSPTLWSDQMDVEAILNDLAHADLEWKITALRYFNPMGCDELGLLGEDPRDVATNLMPIVLRVITGEQPILNIYSDDYDTKDGAAVREYIHVTDIALRQTNDSWCMTSEQERATRSLKLLMRWRKFANKRSRRNWYGDEKEMLDRVWLSQAVHRRS
jgi:hypothetical protein